MIDANYRMPYAGKGVFTISLDFELHWGVFDHTPVNKFSERAKATRLAIPEILLRFEKHKIHATWATVGLLMADNSAIALKNSPSINRSYQSGTGNPYDLLRSSPELDEASAPEWFAPSLVEKVASVHGQEIGSHTYAHYCMLESGTDTKSFEADLKAARSIAKTRGLNLKSLVFPRNQYNDESAAIAWKLGFEAVRGNPEGWIYDPMADKDIHVGVKLLRLLDDYLPVFGHNTHELPLSVIKDQPLNIPASKFLRPSPRALKAFSQFSVRRIKESMTFAAQHGRMYHLWWHPHNFGHDTKFQLEKLDQILTHYNFLNQTYDMQSLNMGDLATESLKTQHERVLAEAV